MTADLTGHRFGRLFVVGPAPRVARDGGPKWVCRCDCGRETTPHGHSLIAGKSTSCGCARARPENLAGRRFGRLVVEERCGSKVTGGVKKPAWRCRCDCGAVCIAIAEALKRGTKQSCGCLHLETVRNSRRTHGASYTRAFRIWAGILNRTRNPALSYFHRYGGRGIRACDRWATFENFLEDMGEPPIGMTIERIDNDGHYEPGNCRWATRAEQARNRDANVYVDYEGERMCMAEAARRAGLSRGTVQWRLKNGVPASRLFDPPRRRVGGAT